MSYPVSLSQLLTEGPFNDCLNSFIYDSGVNGGGERERVGWDGMGWDARKSLWIESRGGLTAFDGDGRQP